MKVVIIGATGETGQSITKGLLEYRTQFDLTAVTRQSSLNSVKNQALKDAGVEIVAADLSGPEEDLVKILTGADVVIAVLDASAFLLQIPLANAAKKAGVKRFVPTFFATIVPPKGALSIRETKEEVLNHIKKIYLPYTVIDVGWWYQITPPRLPSGRIDQLVILPMEGLYGDGNVPSAITDSRDIGRYVARIITDPRTLNKSVFAYSEVLTQREIFQIMEEASGEKLDYNYISNEDAMARVVSAQIAAEAAGLGDKGAQSALAVAQYTYSTCVRGDNTPDYARYLGYLDGKELYPDVDFIPFRKYVSELIDGTARRAYA
ncbi:isoflavone reductase [Penicillium hordei]|uniref:Isoflavone reductase n=1 Tax=Penicillium hordei TaxID=40994 RepID=A0AAD6DKN9_9EURO|nr:isoflavone reductase [Penicillium hordei]KAJ5588200.1 isoflavone reductase [Penicillium hordei]